MCYKYFLVILVTTFSTRLFSQEMTHADSLNVVVDNYYKQNVVIFQAGSTVADIDSIFNLFTEDFTYVHPKYGGTYSRQVLYDGYVRNQKNGGYNGNVMDIKIINKITGLNAVVIQKRFVTKGENGEPVEEEDQMTLFEFREGKISRIFEYW